MRNTILIIFMCFSASLSAARWNAETKDWTDALEFLSGLKHGTGILGIVLQEEY